MLDVEEEYKDTANDPSKGITKRNALYCIVYKLCYNKEINLSDKYK